MIKYNSKKSQAKNETEKSMRSDAANLKFMKKV
jgi:hypothetical protein